VSAAVTAPRSRLRPRATRAPAWARPGGLAATAAVFVLAAALRIVALSRSPLDPFYDAAVRSMATSPQAFLVGAFDPSARVAIDKPPVDLWLQVAATRLFGFRPFALLLPAALGGTLAVVALHDLVRTLVSPRAALAAALALAVLPVAVITARSDTMDSVMAALLVTAFAVAARGLRRGRTASVVAAGALVGLAFEVKLFEALVAVLPLALMWGLGAAGSRRRRVVQGGGAAVACVTVGLAWLVAVSTLVPANARPWAFGSTDGSAWNSAFVYDGWDRVSDAAVQASATPAAAGALRRVPAPPGPLRLLSARDGLLGRIGVELAAAWIAVALVLLTRASRRLDRAATAGLAAMAVWLALGTVLFSGQGALRPRYLAMPAAQAAALSAYLRALQGGARYEVASLATSPVAPVVVRDGRPVLILTALGHPLESTGGLARLVARGQVRDALAGPGCRSAGCAVLRRWIRAHGTDVSAAAGQPRGTLYAFSGRPAPPAPPADGGRRLKGSSAPSRLWPSLKATSQRRP
jgi:4-amino-4-deoxy-L-arabinose transferase-like glycosyltransferase